MHMSTDDRTIEDWFFGSSSTIVAKSDRMFESRNRYSEDEQTRNDRRVCMRYWYSCAIQEERNSLMRLIRTWMDREYANLSLDLAWNVGANAKIGFLLNKD